MANSGFMAIETCRAGARAKLGRNGHALKLLDRDFGGQRASELQRVLFIRLGERRAAAGRAGEMQQDLLRLVAGRAAGLCTMPTQFVVAGLIFDVE